MTRMDAHSNARRSPISWAILHVGRDREVTAGRELDQRQRPRLAQDARTVIPWPHAPVPLLDLRWRGSAIGLWMPAAGRDQTRLLRTGGVVGRSPHGHYWPLHENPVGSTWRRPTE